MLIYPPSHSSDVPMWQEFVSPTSSFLDSRNESNYNLRRQGSESYDVPLPVKEPSNQSAVIQRSGGAAGAQAKTKMLTGTLLRPGTGRTLEVLHPPQRRLQESPLHPDSSIDQTFRVSCPPGPTLPDPHPNLASAETTHLPHSSTLPSTARSMASSL